MANSELLEDIITEVVESMKESTAIQSFAVITQPNNSVGNMATITVDDVSLFGADKSIRIEQTTGQAIESARIKSISGNQITIFFHFGILIDPIIAKQNDPYFLDGDWLTTANQLLTKQSNRSSQNNKFPMIHLLQNISSKVDHKNNFVEEADISIFISEYTRLEYSTKQRRENVLKPTLIPIYERFMEALKDHVAIRINYRSDLLPHTKTPLYFLGTESDNKNKYNSRVDAIQIKIDGLKYDSKYKDCVH